MAIVDAAAAAAQMSNTQVKDNGKQATANTNAAVENPFAQPTKQGAFSWLNPETVSLWSVGRNPQSEIVIAMKDAFGKFAANFPAPVKFDTIVIDNNNSELQYSVFVLLSLIHI